MPTWIAPKLPPPAKTKAVVAGRESIDEGKAQTLPLAGASHCAPFGGGYSSGEMGEATISSVVPAKAGTHTA